jgi:hypothetical protein
MVNFEYGCFEKLDDKKANFVFAFMGKGDHCVGREGEGGKESVCCSQV